MWHFFLGYFFTYNFLRYFLPAISHFKFSGTFYHRVIFPYTPKNAVETGLEVFLWYLDSVLPQTMGCWTHISLICLCLSTSLQTPTVYQHPSVSFRDYVQRSTFTNIFVYLLFVSTFHSTETSRGKYDRMCLCSSPTWCFPLCHSFQLFFKRLFRYRNAYGKEFLPHRYSRRLIVRKTSLHDKIARFRVASWQTSCFSCTQDYIIIQLLFLIKKKNGFIFSKLLPGERSRLFEITPRNVFEPRFILWVSS